MSELVKRVYITDKQGGFYKLDKTGQLTRARSKEDAYTFTVKDAVSRIGTGKRARLYDTVEYIPEDITSNYDAPELSSVKPVKRYENFGNQVERLVREMCDVSDHINDQKAYLVSELSIVDQKICDVLHYLEFEELSTTEFARAGKLLKELRQNRREIKDDLDRIHTMQSTFMDSQFSVMLNESMQQMEDMKNRHYIPRQLSELFDQKVS